MLLPASPRVHAQEEPRRATITALRRRRARPAGPRRGRLWHTTGADLEGRTQGLALTTPRSPRYSHGEALKPRGDRMCARPVHRGSGAARGAGYPGLALRVWPQPLKRASCKYKLCGSSLSLKSAALSLLLMGTMSLERCWHRRSRSKPVSFHSPTEVRSFHSTIIMPFAQ